MFRRALHRILSSTAAATAGMFSLPAVQKKEEEEEEEEEEKLDLQLLLVVRRRM